ncbi:relaxase/mobilization nuclease domain-containing protein [Clostridioides difficile]|nr:relaxase/mobilization nuclease domain-containing protein [Clostridioides difficile]
MPTATTYFKKHKISKGETISQSLKGRFDYGKNPDKTEGGELISSYACDHMTADAEFLLSKAKYKATTGREQRRDADVLCYQIRQSFKPGEITPEDANRVGYETAMRWTKGKYAFFVATHTDRQHIHNHIYYNSTSLDCAHKFRDFIGSARAVRRLSDRVCLENDLSVIANPKLHSKGRFLHYGAWAGADRQPSYKERLRHAIRDALAKGPADFNAFLRLMEEAGFTVKQGRGGAISFLVPGQQRATRLRSSTLGEGYDPEDIRAVIAGKRPLPEVGVPAPAAPARVNLIVDIQERLRDRKGPAYERWAKIYNLKQMAAALGADGIVNPTYYWRSKGTSRGGSKSTLEPTKWGHTTIKKILTTQEYCGDVINFKSYSKSYKMKRRIENPEENRAIFLNVHEAIIDRPTWEKVQALKAGTRRKRPTVTQEPSAFSGVMKCPECGGNLNFHFNQNNHDIKFFSCQNHNSGLRKCSSTHYIRLDFLEQVVLYEVHRLACFANEYENDFIKAMVGRSAKVAENERVRKKRELDGLLARDRELDTLFERLYEDNVSGKIDDARFAKMAKRYEQEQGENAGRIKALRLEVKKLEEKRMDVDDFLETVRHYTNAAKITKRMVAELIDHIEVYPAVKEDGVTNQRVTIHYNCIGAFEVPDRRKIPERDILLETRKGVALSYAPAV